MRKSRAIAAAAGASSIALLAGQAAAVSTSPPLPAILLPSGSQHVLAMCAAVPVGPGVGSTGGTAYEIQGVAVDTEPGTVAGQVECALYDTDTRTFLVVVMSGFGPGLAARLTTTYTVRTSDNFVVCVKADDIDDFGNQTSTGWRTTDGSPCGS